MISGVLVGLAAIMVAAWIVFTLHLWFELMEARQDVKDLEGLLTSSSDRFRAASAAHRQMVESIKKLLN